MNIFQVDAFTDKPFKGNPAGVCILDKPRPDSWMQNLAMEMNLSETAFLLKESEGYRLRWFTPETEVSLCGHATLASAHILWEKGFLEKDQNVVFNTLSGTLVTRRIDDWIEMEFPSRQVTPGEAPESLLKVLNIRPLTVNMYSHKGSLLYLFELQSEEDVKNTTPDFRLLKSEDAKVVMITSRSKSEEYDFVSRFFAPAVGIDEDPVTGSAHCYLAPYWAGKLNKTELVGFQASKRTGVIFCRVSGEHVYIRGKAITVFEGELKV